MTVFVILLLVAASLAINHTSSALHHGLEIRQFRPARAWKRFSGDWATVAGRMDSAPGGRPSWSHADRPSKKQRPEVLWLSSFPFIRTPESPHARRRAHSDVNSVRTKARRPGFLKASTISHSEAFPDHGIDVHSAITTSANTGLRQKSRPFGRKDSDRELQSRPRSSHPIYFGIGNDAIDAAYTTYLGIVGTSARNQRKPALNPVGFFVGRR